MAWYERRYASLGLRLAGIALLGVAALIGRHLFAVADPSARGRALPYLLALIWMVSLSAGAALAVLGRHLFDRIPLSARWTIHIPPRA